MAKAPAPKIKMPSVPKLPKAPAQKNVNLGASTGLKGYMNASKITKGMFGS